MTEEYSIPNYYNQNPRSESEFEQLTENLADEVRWGRYYVDLMPTEIIIHLYKDDGTLIGSWNVGIDHSPTYYSQRCGTVKML